MYFVEYLTMCQTPPFKVVTMYYPHFTDEETEKHRNVLTCPRTLHLVSGRDRMQRQTEGLAPEPVFSTTKI